MSDKDPAFAFLNSPGLLSAKGERQRLVEQFCSAYLFAPQDRRPAVIASYRVTFEEAVGRWDPTLTGDQVINVATRMFVDALHAASERQQATLDSYRAIIRDQGEEPIA